jgi:excisionase family DNA binding protein
MNNLIFSSIPQNELEQLIENSVRKVLKHQPEQPAASGDFLMTIEDAAKFLSLTKPTIYAYVSRGEIPSMKRSKRLYFSREDLMNYVRQGRRKTNSEIAANADDFLVTKKRRIRR